MQINRTRVWKMCGYSAELYTFFVVACGFQKGRETVGLAAGRWMLLVVVSQRKQLGFAAVLTRARRKSIEITVSRALNAGSVSLARM